MTVQQSPTYTSIEVPGGPLYSSTSARWPSFSKGLAKDPTTRRLWYGLATVHDLESYDGATKEKTYQAIFASHFGHLAVIFLWTSGNLFHVAWQGNFEQWVADPVNTSPIAHRIWDPHFGEAATKAFTPQGAVYPVNLCYSGVYNWWYTIGLRTDTDLYLSALFLVGLAGLMLFAGTLKLQPKFRPSQSWFENNESRLNHHIAGLFGFSSIAWAGHLVHVALPESRGKHVGWDNFLFTPPHPQGLAPLFQGLGGGIVEAVRTSLVKGLPNEAAASHPWSLYAQNPDAPGHIFNSDINSGTAILTFIGGFDPYTKSLWLSDVAHHHLALGVILVIAGHMYRTNWQKGHSLKAILEAHVPPSGMLGEGHKGLFETITDSLHLQLCFALAAVGVACSLAAQHIYALPAYAFLGSDKSLVAQAALYTHHQYIAGFLMVGAFAHGAIFLVQDYNPVTNRGNVLARVLAHKEAIISHLSWVTLFLGTHTLGLYVHNDVVVAFGQPEKQILIEPVFAQFVQASSGKAIYLLQWDAQNASSISPASIFNINPDARGFITNGAWVPGWLSALNNSDRPVNDLFLDIGPGDFLVHHAIALGLHTTTLILVKGALDARGSKLMPDKNQFGYSFPCDGPGRGGTCDISAWDAFYLAMFWMLNTIGWVTFYWHWKHLAIWQQNPAFFDESSNYLMGWLRDYLWLNSSKLINGYSPMGVNSNAVWAWMFLFGHLVWATGFMFLISWRGYWQELIETLVWAHERTPIANLIRWKDKPVALSIVQARLVGLAHFTVGYILTYAAFVIASTERP